MQDTKSKERVIIRGGANQVRHSPNSADNAHRVASLVRERQVAGHKMIPKVIAIPREISLDALVKRAILAFDTNGDVFQLVLPLPLNIFCLRKPDHIKAITSRKECGTIKPAGVIPKAD